MEDIVDKKTIIINGKNISDIIVNIEPIKNVTNIKIISINATLTTANAENLKKLYLFINDYGLKTLYDDNKYKSGINVFSNLIFLPSSMGGQNMVYNNTGITDNFYLDTENYTFNPILGELNKLNISFKLYNDNDDLSEPELESVVLADFSLELCIYSNRKKITMY